MLAKLKNHWPIIVLLLITLFLCARNYTLGTWLSGWDTLHPEFNFGLNFERYITGVFRVEQGLGAVTGHSHMADLPRLIILYLFHFFLPLDFLRYFYVFLNVIIGTLGIYFFLNKYVLKQKTASFLGSLFYLLNIGTVQIFNVPFEMFTTLFAFLPFIFYFATAFLVEVDNRRKNLLLFGFFTLLNSPSAYAATLWYVFFITFFIYFFSFALIIRKEYKGSLKYFAVLIVIFLAVNLFWIAPNIYFVLNHAKEVQQANINLLFSSQAFLKNKEFGNITDLLLLKSFYFDWNIYQGNNFFTDLLNPYILHFKNIPALVIGYGLGISSLLGILLGIKKIKLKFIPFLLIFLFCLFFLINDNFPTSTIFGFFQNHFPFFKEAFRFPDNKILNIYVFLVSIFFGFFTLSITEKLKKIKPRFETIFVFIITLLIFYYSLPSLFGNFINQYMRIQIPKQYFALFNYLDKKPESLRVANLPISSPWGWLYYNWYNDKKPSFQGAGFLYFGIKQPLLDRDFDRWSPYNESYYREMSYAIYRGDQDLLKNVINKYKIGFIFIDRNVIVPQNPKSILYLDESKKLLEASGLIEDAQYFGNIELFKLKTNANTVTAVNTNLNILPPTNTIYKDFAYNQNSDYITFTSENNFNNTFFPFRDLIDNQSRIRNTTLDISDEQITLNPQRQILNFQTGQNGDDFNLIPSDLIIEKNLNTLNISLYPNLPIFNNTSSALPIKGTINVDQKIKNLSISVNQNELFNLSALPDNAPVAIAKVTLRNDDNTLNIFNSDMLKSIDNVATIINPLLSSCNGGQTPQAEFTQDKIQITGRGSICILLPYGFFPTQINGQDTNILTNFEFGLIGNAQINSCLFNQENGNCIYHRSPTRIGNNVSFSYVFASNKTQSTALKIIIQNNSNNQTTYSLTNLKASYAQPIVDLDISKELIDKTFLNKQISFDKIYLPKNLVYDPGFIVTGIKQFNNDCPLPQTKAKKEIVSLNGNESVKYSSIDGNFCDHFSYQNLPHDQSYLIMVTSQNEAGLPLSLCARNHISGRCDIYSELSDFKVLNKDIFLLPSMNDNGIGYDIGFSNLGIKGSPAINYLTALDLIPIPYNFLGNIKTKTQDGKINLNGKIKKIIKYNSAFYLATTDGKPTIVNLNASYEKGFKAYYLNCTSNIDCAIKGILSPIFAKEVSDHLLVNNWANGWLIKNGNQIAIIFLPQYLEYFGFAVLLITLFFLFKPATKLKKLLKTIASDKQDSGVKT